MQSIITTTAYPQLILSNPGGLNKILSPDAEDENVDTQTSGLADDESPESNLYESTLSFSDIRFSSKSASNSQGEQESNSISGNFDGINNTGSRLLANVSQTLTRNNTNLRFSTTMTGIPVRKISAEDLMATRKLEDVQKVLSVVDSEEAANYQVASKAKAIFSRKPTFFNAVPPPNVIKPTTKVSGKNVEKLTPLEKFRKAAASVLAFVRASRLMSLSPDFEMDDATDKNSTANPDHYAPATYGGLTFDLELYRVQRKDVLSDRAREVFCKGPEQRTSSDIDVAMDYFQNVKSFEQYNFNTRRELCKIMVYTSYGRNRVIAKQGRPANSFYFIVSGVVLVTREEEDEDTKLTSNKLIATLKQGDSFGEIALVKNITRTATITTKTRCELLKIEKEDFQQLMQSSVQSGMTRKVDFLCLHVPVFKRVPRSKVDKLAINFRAMEFKAHSVILQEGVSLSEDLYIIFKGICKVSKQISIIGRKRADDQYNYGGEQGSGWKYRELNSIGRSRAGSSSEGHRIKFSSALESHGLEAEAGQRLRFGESIVKKNLHLVDLRQGDIFGEDNLFEMTRRQALNDLFQMSPSNNSSSSKIGVGVPEGPSHSQYTVTSETKVECYVIPKIDFVRLLTMEEYETVKNAYLPYPNNMELQRQFIRKTRWDNHKSAYIQSVLAEKQANREQRLFHF